MLDVGYFFPHFQSLKAEVETLMYPRHKLKGKVKLKRQESHNLLTIYIHSTEMRWWYFGILETEVLLVLYSRVGK